MGRKLTGNLSGKKPTSITDRLWPRISIGSDEECWPVSGYTNAKGYGVIGTGRHGKNILMHRLVWMLCRGDHGDLHVLHRCDNPPCCNPAHLFLGTHADNMRDMDIKKRCIRIGERRRRLSSEQVGEMLSSTESSYELSRRLPMTASGIRKLRAKGGYQGASPFDTEVI